MKLAPVLAAAVAVGACAGDPAETPAANEASSWDGGVTVTAVTVGEYASSSSLAVAWEVAENATAYQVSASEAVGGSTVAAEASADATGLTLEGLKSATTYEVVVTACFGAECADSVAAAAATAATAEEVWQIQGSGASVDGALKIVEDGNVKIAAFVYGEDADADLAGRVRLVYGPTGADKGLALALSDAVISGAGDLLSFTRTTPAGLFSPDTPTELVGYVATGQAVPMTAGVVRMFFEARGADGLTRILQLDSRDGLRGEDFHAEDKQQCDTEPDWSGPCLPSVAVAVASDPDGNPKLENARQNKVGFPTMDDWRWDGEAGAFMIITAEKPEGCSEQQRNQAYALFDGESWQVQYDEAGCPKLFEDMQAPAPLHLGGGRYKLYAGAPSQQEGARRSGGGMGGMGGGGPGLPFLGPKSVMYADASRTGDPDVVEFEDWEARDAARGVSFLWPDGSPLDVSAEGYLDDFVFLIPTNDPSLQVMYTAITDGTVLPFATAALLLNP